MDRNRKAAFTLIELLVVIAVIAIIAAILFPVFARVREKGRQTVCLSNLEQIGAATMIYMQDYDETFPFVLNWSANFTMKVGANQGDDGNMRVPGATGQEPPFQLVTQVMPYVRNASTWYCPSVGPGYAWGAGGWKKGATMRDQGTSYQYSYLSVPSPNPNDKQTFMGGKRYAILLEPSRWPMLSDEPSGFATAGNLGDPPTSVAPHSGGINVAYGDGHAKFHRIELSDNAYWLHHSGDGLYPGQ